MQHDSAGLHCQRTIAGHLRLFVLDWYPPPVVEEASRVLGRPQRSVTSNPAVPTYLNYKPIASPSTIALALILHPPAPISIARSVHYHCPARHGAVASPARGLPDSATVEYV